MLLLSLIISMMLVVLKTVRTVGVDVAVDVGRHPDESVRIAKATEMRANTRWNLDPCEDFYEYVCGNYAKENDDGRATATAAASSVEDAVQERILTDLRHLLEEPTTVMDGADGRKVKDFYMSCVRAERNGEEQRNYFSKFMKENGGGLPTTPGSIDDGDDDNDHHHHHHHHHHSYNWQQVVGDLRRRYGMNILVAIVVDANIRNGNENAIYLDEPATLIPAALCHRDRVVAVKGGHRPPMATDRDYDAVRQTVARKLYDWLAMSTLEAKRMATSVVAFEFQLCSAIGSGRRSITDGTSPTTTTTTTTCIQRSLADLTRQFNNSLNFGDIVSTSLRHSVTKMVFMCSEEYYRRLGQVIGHTASQTLANYILFRALSLLDLPANEGARPQHCLDLMKQHFGRTLASMYARKYSDARTKTDVLRIFAHIKDMLATQRRDNDWRQGRRHSLHALRATFAEADKSQSIMLQIERQHFWTNLEQVLAQMQHRELNRLFEEGSTRMMMATARTRTMTTATTRTTSSPPFGYELNVRYEPHYKRIDIGWSRLRPPFYRDEFPEAMKYALIGVALARELHQAFNDVVIATVINDVGIIGDNNNNNNNNHHHHHHHHHHYRIECYRQQISDYLFKPNHPLYNNETLLQQLLTTSDAIAVTFDAYARWLTDLSPAENRAMLERETLPELNFTNTQLFFVTFAQMHCGVEATTSPGTTFNLTSNHKGSYVLSPFDSHTVQRYEVNGVLRSNREFAREFNCAIGSEMNPIEKCSN